MAKAVLLSLALTLAWIALEIAWIHAFRPKRIFRAMTVAFALSWPVLPLVHLATPASLGFLPAEWSRTPSGLAVGTGLLVHLLLYLNWCQFFFYVDRSITLRLLVVLAASPRGERTLDEMRLACGLEPLVRERFSVLRRNGYIAAGEDGSDRITGKGRLAANALLLARRFFGLEFYVELGEDRSPRS